MPLVSTPAVILHAFHYGETSKIVRLATPDHGVLSAIAKGALRARSRFGARLQVLSQGMVQVYWKQNRDLQTLAEFDVSAKRSQLSHDLNRFAAASVLAELVMRCSPAEPQAQVFEDLVAGLDRISDVAGAHLPAVSLAAAWRLVATLGFSPALTTCARDGRPLTPGPAPFSVAEGGLMCTSCARGEGRRLPAADRAALEHFVRGDGPADGTLTPKRAIAHRRLLGRFIRHHLAEGRDLPALTFWESLSWTSTS